MRIKYVAQKHDKGCVIACIAMVLGWEYDKVVKEFKNNFERSGINTDFAKVFICDHGYSVIERRGGGYMDVKKHNKRMMEPFAPIHIVTVRQFVDEPKRTHAFVMDSRGNMFDPDDKDSKKVLFYSAEHVMGFYKD